MMELAHEVSNIQEDTRYLRVSILVMMELAREADRFQCNIDHVPSFNPCYDGIGSRSNYILRKDYGKLIVSILVMMELAHEVFEPFERILHFDVSILVMMELAHEDVSS